MSTQVHTINGTPFKVNEVVEVEELTSEKWAARIVAFKRDSGHVILTDIRRSQYGGHIWRDEKLLRKIVVPKSQRLPTY